MLIMRVFAVSVCINSVTSLYGYLAPFVSGILLFVRAKPCYLLGIFGCIWPECQDWLFVLYYCTQCCPACQCVVVLRSGLTTIVIKLVSYYYIII